MKWQLFHHVFNKHFLSTPVGQVTLSSHEDTERWGAWCSSPSRQPNGQSNKNNWSMCGAASAMNKHRKARERDNCQWQWPHSQRHRSHQEGTRRCASGRRGCGSATEQETSVTIKSCLYPEMPNRADVRRARLGGLAWYNIYWVIYFLNNKIFIETFGMQGSKRDFKHEYKNNIHQNHIKTKAIV